MIPGDQGISWAHTDLRITRWDQSGTCGTHSREQLLASVRMCQRIRKRSLIEAAECIDNVDGFDNEDDSDGNLGSNFC